MLSGESAGGHLSLTMGTQGAPGKADAKDPIDRASSGADILESVGSSAPLVIAPMPSRSMAGIL